jgi:hypothetical protein
LADQESNFVNQMAEQEAIYQNQLMRADDELKILEDKLEE